MKQIFSNIPEISMVHLICALKHEARPVIEHFLLVHDGSAGLFTSYKNDEKGITLTVTGPGKQAAARATEFVIRHYHVRPEHAWLNLGIAGHKNLDIGTPVLASRITDNNASWSPEITFDTGLYTCEINTLDTPSTDYGDAIYDMEATGYFGSAIRISTPDKIHCLKIISDNTAHPAHNISGKSIRDLINKNIDEIDNLVSRLQSICLKP